MLFEMIANKLKMLFQQYKVEIGWNIQMEHIKLKKRAGEGGQAPETLEKFYVRANEIFEIL